jgi:hypothetical protein
VTPEQVILQITIEDAKLIGTGRKCRGYPVFYVTLLMKRLKGDSIEGLNRMIELATKHATYWKRNR